jgi:hypothetical protein
MSTNALRSTLFAIALIGLAAAGAAMADGAEIVKSLTGDLGITEDQAIGGTKALLNVAKSNLGDQEFGELLSGHPGLSALSKRDGGLAGKMAGKMGDGDAAGKIADMAGGGLASLAENADLVQSFSDLGMDSGMLEKFAGQLLDAVGGGGPGAGLMSPKTKLLRKGLGLL